MKLTLLSSQTPLDMSVFLKHLNDATIWNVRDFSGVPVPSAQVNCPDSLDYPGYVKPYCADVTVGNSTSREQTQITVVDMNTNDVASKLAFGTPLVLGSME
jgi:hypothetical protein